MHKSYAALAGSGVEWSRVETAPLENLAVPVAIGALPTATSACT